VAGASCQFNASFNDETDLATTGGYIFSNDTSGSYVNSTWTAFTSTPETVSLTQTLLQTIDTTIIFGISMIRLVTGTAQVRDKDGTDIARVFSITGTLANASRLDVDTDSSGSYELATSVGSHSFAVWWGTHLVNSSVSYSATANATLNLDTRIESYADGSNYILWSINGTSLPMAETVAPQNCKLSPVSFSSAPELKVDVANWLRSSEPSAVNVGGLRFDKTNWLFDSSNVLSYTLGAATDTFIILEWDSGGAPDGTSENNNNQPSDSTAPDNTPPYQILPSPTPKPFVMPAEVTQAAIVVVAFLAVFGLLGYVYVERKAQADSQPTRGSKRKEPKRKW
jgi:hypothetical protein